MPIQILDSFNLTNHELNRPRQIDIAEGVDDVHLDFIQQQWRPVLERQEKLAKMSLCLLPMQQQTHNQMLRLLNRRGAPDAHWLWRRKVEDMTDEDQAYIALDENSVEAVMVICKQRASKFQLQTPANTTYIKYLAVAPWNREKIKNPRRYGGLGSILLATAVSVSIDEGNEGRCGLHSMSSAETFYQDNGMTDFGPDVDEEGMRYFEFSANAANTFIGGNNDSS